MIHKCSNCGYRSADAGFFRKARGGLLHTRQTVCDACTPYQPTAYERRVSVGLLLTPFFYFFFVALITHGHASIRTVLLPLLVLTASTTPLRIFVHEAGHALLARMHGHIVWRTQIGSGPVRHKFTIGSIPFETCAYPWTGGRMSHFNPAGPSKRGARAAIVMAGPTANALIATLCLVAANSVVAANVASTLLSTFGYLNLIMAVYNLIPRRFGDNESVASDGQRLLDILFKPTSDADPRRDQLLQTVGYGALRRYDDMIAAASDAWQTAPLKYMLAAIIAEGLSRTQGDRAALDFYLAHESEFQGGEDIAQDREAHLHILESTIALSVLKLGDPTFTRVAEVLSKAAFDTASDAPEMQGAYGAWLASVDRIDEGLPVLVQGTRKSGSLLDKADFCIFLARAWRQKGDEQRAAQYDALQVHLRAKP